MRFRKGTKVEVLTHKEVPSGSWRCAEIIGGNGHSYTVKYDGDNMMGSFGEQDALVERVSRKAIRPCPPLVDVVENWVVGDVVEVFHNFSWKMATVLKMLGWNHLVVRLLGSGVELKVSRHDVRARLCWQDGEWMVIGKASSKCEDLKLRLPSSRKESEQLNPITRHQITDKKCVLDSQGVSRGRTLKRKQSHPDSHAEGDPRQAHKIRLGKKKEKIWHPPVNVKQQQLQLPEKVDDVASLQLHPEKFVRPFTLQTLNGGLGCSRSSMCLVEPENSDHCSITSSVGSCSVIHNRHYIHNGAGPWEENNDKNNSECSSDAESFCGLRPEVKEGLSEEIHRLELHAYRRIIEALHASGPLSWDQELLLTNLRDSLHISNDEHLREIRSLVSSSGPCIIPC